MRAASSGPPRPVMAAAGEARAAAAVATARLVESGCRDQILGASSRVHWSATKRKTREGLPQLPAVNPPQTRS